jgi:ubiquinone/menaquinone biosynthesis C-methylase UbiE
MKHSVLSNPLVFQLQQRVFNNYGNVKAEFEDYLRPGPLRILDVGCSTGACGQAVFDTARDDYTGIDITDRYVAYAGRSYSHGKYVEMDARNLAFDRHSFDVVSFIGVLHHMDDDTARRSLSEARRVLREGGALLVAEPVFTPNDLRSNVFLSLDRGRYIRETGQYEALLHEFQIERRRHFRFSFHRFASFVCR